MKYLYFIIAIICLIQVSNGQDVKINFSESNNGSWKSQRGEWEISDTNYLLKKGTGYILTSNCSFREFEYSSDITIRKKGSAGLLFHVCPANNQNDTLLGYYTALDASSDSIRLFKLFINDKNDFNKKLLIALPYHLEQNIRYTMKIHRKGFLIEMMVNNEMVISILDKDLSIGSVGLFAENTAASFENIHIKNLISENYNWSWVKGAIYIPTNCVNQIQQWEEFDPSINNRELKYASTYGINVVRVYLHYLVWSKDRKKFLSDVETFLALANKHNIKVVISFFDDVWDGEPRLGPQLPPVPGQHNKRWAQCPGNYIKDHYNLYRDSLKMYVQDVVSQHLNDHRILFWEPYNEPGFLMKGNYLTVSKILLNDSRIWIKETGTQIPLTSTADPDFLGNNFSDFYSWHSYTRNYSGPEGPAAINTECMNRFDQTLAGIIDNYGKRKTGFIIWELGIGKTNSRFHWVSQKNSPEPTMPFQGLIYPDGHPWDTNEVALLRGNLADLPVFNVRYFSGDFEIERKWSFTPSIDFDLGDEAGTGSPDASAGIGKDNFSIEWTGQILSKDKGLYSFYITSDNIVRMWVNDELVLEKKTGGLTTVKTDLELKPGKLYDICIEYYHNSGESSMHVEWRGPGFEREVLPGRRKKFREKVFDKETMFSTKN